MSGELDRRALTAIREALREEGVPEAGVLDRLLAAPTVRSAMPPLTPGEAFRVFSVLIGIEWRRGKMARCGGMPIHALVTAWRGQSGIAGFGEEPEA